LAGWSDKNSAYIWVNFPEDSIWAREKKSIPMIIPTHPYGLYHHSSVNSGGGRPYWTVCASTPGIGSHINFIELAEAVAKKNDYWGMKPKGQTLSLNLG